jgi:hypothetical protein
LLMIWFRSHCDKKFAAGLLVSPARPPLNVGLFCFAILLGLMTATGK